MIALVFLILTLTLGGSAQHQQHGFQEDFTPVYYPELYQEQFPGAYSLQQPQQFAAVAHPEVHQAQLPARIQDLLTYDRDLYGQVTGASAFQQASPLSYTELPVPAAAVTAAPFVPIDSQYQTVDEYGQYAFGFSGGDTARTETRDAYGNVRGSYNYIDSDGVLQTQHYVADQYGFRVLGSNIPKGPRAQELASPTAPAIPSPQPVQDTPEVAAAKAAFVKAYNKAALAAAEAPDVD